MFVAFFSDIKVKIELMCIKYVPLKVVYCSTADNNQYNIVVRLLCNLPVHKSFIIIIHITPQGIISTASKIM